MTRQDITPITRRSAEHARWSSGADGRNGAQGYRLIPSKFCNHVRSIGRIAHKRLPMPSMEWEAFQHDHHRPHLLIVRKDVKGKSTPSMAKTHFERLAVKLGASGN